jgi:hypothetical protein
MTKGSARKVTDLIQELGLWRSLTYGLDRVLKSQNAGLRLFHYDIIIQPVAKKRLVPTSLGRSIEVRQMREGDGELELMPVPMAVIQKRFSQSAICLGAFESSKLIGYLWLCLGAYEEDEVRCRFEPQPIGKVAWDFDMFVWPEHRHGLAFAVIWDAANSFLRAREIESSFSRIAGYNLSSWQAHARLGARRLATALYLRGTRLQWMVASVRPFVHLSTSPSRRPVLRLVAKQE